MRKPIIAGNWKMHYTLGEGLAMVQELIPLVEGAAAEVVLCVPYIHLTEVVKAVAGHGLRVGAQNMHFEDQGAFTGEIAPGMLKDLGVEYVIIGHSERRQYFAETDATVNLKLKSAHRHGLIPILCLGETLAQREAGETEAHLERQIREGLAGITEAQLTGTVIAYEPIWAIGTGRTATAEDANTTIAFIRGVLGGLYRKEAAETVRILYGGSVKPDTIKEQMAMSDIDGALVGGASLKAGDFASIATYDR